MPGRKLSANSLKTRIDELRRRHRALDAKVENEQLRAWPDAPRLKALKRERLGLRDTIRMTQTLLKRAAQPPRRNQQSA